MVSTIDVHAHVTVPAYLESLASAGVRLPGYRSGVGAPVAATGSTTPTDASSVDDDAVQRRLELMERAEVAHQVLSPTVGPYAADARDASRSARLINMAHAELAARHPGRFSFFAALPLPHVREALVELEHALDTLDAVGVTIHCSVGDRSVADSAFEPVLAELDRRGSVLFLHPAVNGICSALVDEWGLSASAGTIFEDTTAALHLISKRIPARFPDLDVVVPHLGGALPMLLNRLDNQLPMSVPDLPEPPSVTARRFWYDTVAHGSSAALNAAVEAFGSERILMGSDYPVMLPFETYGETVSHLDAAGLPLEVVHRIRRTNAETLLGGSLARAAMRA